MYPNFRREKSIIQWLKNVLPKETVHLRKILPQVNSASDFNPAFSLGGFIVCH